MSTCWFEKRHSKHSARTVSAFCKFREDAPKIIYRRCEKHMQAPTELLRVVLAWEDTFLTLCLKLFQLFAKLGDDTFKLLDWKYGDSLWPPVDLLIVCMTQEDAFRTLCPNRIHFLAGMATILKKRWSEHITILCGGFCRNICPCWPSEGI